MYLEHCYSSSSEDLNIQIRLHGYPSVGRIPFNSLPFFFKFGHYPFCLFLSFFSPSLTFLPTPTIVSASHPSPFPFLSYKFHHDHHPSLLVKDDDGELRSFFIILRYSGCCSFFQFVFFVMTLCCFLSLFSYLVFPSFLFLQSTWQRPLNSADSRLTGHNNHNFK